MCVFKLKCREGCGKTVHCPACTDYHEYFCGHEQSHTCPACWATARRAGTTATVPSLQSLAARAVGQDPVSALAVICQDHLRDYHEDVYLSTRLHSFDEDQRMYRQQFSPAAMKVLQLIGRKFNGRPTVKCYCY